MQPNGSDKAGRSLWFDLPVSNLADAMSFYEGLLGWTYQQMESSPLMDYVMIQTQGILIGGLRKVDRINRNLEGSAILYFNVDKLAVKVARAKELGAQIVGKTVSLGGDRGHYQWIRDRDGHLLGLWARE